MSILLPMARPELSGQALVRCCELFGISEGTSRVALSRLLASGELHGEGGRYRLSGPLLERRRRQEQGRHPPVVPWSGGWVLAVVTAPGGPGTTGGRGAAERTSLRTDLRRRRMAELREGIWARPDNLGENPAPPALPAPPPAFRLSLPSAPPVPRPEEAAPSAACLWMRDARLVEPEPAAAALCARLWDLAGWAAQARRLVERLAETEPALHRGDAAALAPGFQAAAAAVRHLTADPLLPGELLPDGWPGAALRRDYDRYEAAYQQVLRGWLRGLPAS